MQDIQDFCKNRFNGPVAESVFKQCQDRGAVFPISEDFFLNFIKLSDEDTSVIIAGIINEKKEEILKNVSDGTWTKDTEIVAFLMSYLEMIAFGMVTIDAEGSFGYSAPQGTPPSPETIKAIDEKLCLSVSLIRDELNRFIQKNKKS